MVAKAKRHSQGDIPRNILDAIERVWPDSIVQVGYDFIEESYFHKLYPKLQRSLSSIKGASLRYEREVQEQRRREDDWDSDDSDWSDNLPIDDRTYSDHLFFIFPDDKLFRYETETEDIDEEDADVEETIAGEGFVGCVVGVSLVARFAVIGLSSLHEYENGSHTGPELELCGFDENGERLGAEEFVRSQVGDDGLRLLHKLRDRIAKVLESHRITLLSEQDQQRPVPWLRAGEEILKKEGPVTVKGAFFFEAL